MTASNPIAVVIFTTAAKHSDLMAGARCSICDRRAARARKAPALSPGLSPPTTKRSKPPVSARACVREAELGPRQHNGLNKTYLSRGRSRIYWERVD
jgi:hypothetical protein